MVMDNGSLEYEGVAFTHQAVVSCVPAWIVALLELDVAELTALPFGEFCPNFDLIPNDLQRDGPVKDVFVEAVRSVGADPSWFKFSPRTWLLMLTMRNEDVFPLLEVAASIMALWPDRFSCMGIGLQVEFLSHICLICAIPAPLSLTTLLDRSLDS